jgi:hypothetical protein
MENLCERAEKFWILLRGIYADKISCLIEGFIYASFLTATLLSFPSQLGNPYMFAAMLGLTCWVVCRLIPTTSGTQPLIISHGERTYVLIILTSLGMLLFFSLFTAPISSDGQRIKLARIIMNVYSGSAWDVSRVDSHSSMYQFPSAYYLIYTFIEALHLPKLAYGLFNSIMVIGSFFTVMQMGKHLRAVELLCVLVFLAAPQIIFAALSEQEEALTLFLSIRAAYWLISGRPPVSLVMAGIAGGMAVGSKYSVATFLPITTLVFLAYFSNRQHIARSFTPKHLLLATPVVIAFIALIFLPDILVSQASGKGFLSQITALSAIHQARDTSCWLPHAGLRFFEMLVDYPNSLLSLTGLSISHLLPEYSFLPKYCTSDPTLLASYIHSDELSRTSVQFGIIPFFSLIALFLSRGKERWIATISVVAFIGAVLLFTSRFTYWMQTGRYFIVAYLALMPAFLISMQALLRRFTKTYIHAILIVIAIPAMTVFVHSEVDIKAAGNNFLKGDYYSRQANVLSSGLAPVTGPANIYFNDIMSFHSLLKIIPSRDVTLHKTLTADRTNIVAVPAVYDNRTNLHEAEWMLPIPDDAGQYVFIGNTGNFYGNSVPTKFFRNLLPEDNNLVQRFRLVYVPPSIVPGDWAAVVPNLKVTPVVNAKHRVHFISLDHASGKGICVFTSSNSMTWYVGAAPCKDEP